MAHYHKEKCKVCLKVIMECRCPRNKLITWGVCAECAAGIKRFKEKMEFKVVPAGTYQYKAELE